MRVRANRGGLFNTTTPKRAGYKDTHYDYICYKCKKKILKSDSNISIPDYAEGRYVGKKVYHWDCKPSGSKFDRGELLKKADEMNLFIPDGVSDKMLDSIVRFEESRIILLRKLFKKEN